MFSAVGEVRSAMGAYAEAFDASLLSGADAAVVVEHAAAIEKMAAVVGGLAAARVSDCSGWRREGDRSPAHNLARKTGKSLSSAVEVLETAAKLSLLPLVSGAARRGELSSSQASAIASAATVDPSSEKRLVESRPPYIPQK